MTDKIRVFRTDRSFPHSEIPRGVATFGVRPIELHMTNCNGGDPSFVFVANGLNDTHQVRMEIPFSEFNEALAELGYTLYQP